MSKRKTLLSLFSLISILGLGLVSCNNEVPIKGDQGEQGPIGPAGENGNDGKDGSIIHTGQGKPNNTLGKDTDLYIDSNTGDLYTKENGSWSLTMNIKGEDGKDGQDGQNGSNGSSGSNGNTAWSNTILPSNDGYIIVSSGSTLEGNNVTFTFVPTNDLSEGETLEWSVKDKDNNEVTDLENDDNSFTFETTMKKGGFVVSAEIIEPNIQNVASKDQLLESLNNLEEGENIIILNQDITLDAEDITDKTRINNVSTLANNNDDIDNFFRTGKIVLKNNNKKPTNVKIMANGKGRTFTFPFLTIEGENIGTFEFNNVKLICDYDLDKIGNTTLYGFNNFINATGVDEIKFNNTEFGIKINEKYRPGIYAQRGTPNFLNFDGTKLSINNFKALSENSSYGWAFISLATDTMNQNLKEISINNSEIYTSMPFLIDYLHDDITPLYNLNIDVNNTTFYNSSPEELMPFFTLYSDYDYTDEIKLNLELNVNNVHYNSFWDNSYPLYWTGPSNGIISITDRPQKYPNEDNDPETLLNIDVEPYAVDYSDKIKINMHNFYENNQKITFNNKFSVMPKLDYEIDYYDENGNEIDTPTNNYFIKWNEEQYDSLVEDQKFYVEHIVQPLNTNWNAWYVTKQSIDSSKFPKFLLDGQNIYED